MRVLAPLTVVLSLVSPVSAAQQPPPRPDAAARLLPQQQSPQLTAEEFEAQIAALEKAAAANPADPGGYLAIARKYQERLQRQPSIGEAERWRAVLLGIQAVDRSLGVDPNYVEALVYKNILLRYQAGLEPDQLQRERLIKEADALRARALEIQNRVGAGNLVRADEGTGVRQACPPRVTRATDDGQTPLRVGGNIRPPTKTRDVKPVYPPDAQQARISGVVIMEVLVTTAGEVADPCVLRSVAGLDQAAMDAVTQWRFEPVLLNGRPVPVIMTVTVNFTLQ